MWQKYLTKRKEDDRKKYFNKINREQAKYVSVNETTINLKVSLISSFKDKINHLILLKEPKLNEGYYFVNKKAFNSFAIFYQMDLIFCNKNHQVIKVIENFSSQKITPYVKNAYFIFCLTAGAIHFFEIKLTDVIKIEKH